VDDVDARLTCFVVTRNVVPLFLGWTNSITGTTGGFDSLIVSL
jgi:hypothetical protein